MMFVEQMLVLPAELLFALSLSRSYWCQWYRELLTWLESSSWFNYFDLGEWQPVCWRFVWLVWVVTWWTWVGWAILWTDPYEEERIRLILNFTYSSSLSLAMMSASSLSIVPVPVPRVAIDSGLSLALGTELGTELESKIGKVLVT